MASEPSEVVKAEDDSPKATVFTFANAPKKPDKQELEKQAEALQADIEKLQEKLKSIKIEIDKISNDRSGSKVYLKELVIVYSIIVILYRVKLTQPNQRSKNYMRKRSNCQLKKVR